MSEEKAPSVVAIETFRRVYDERLARRRRDDEPIVDSNEMILARMRGVPVNQPNSASDADPQSPNVVD